MRRTDFASALNKYLTHFLPDVKGVSFATIESYRQAFILFLTFMHDSERLDADKIKIQDLTSPAVVDFLSWLESERGNKTSTRNQRQAVINSFIHYLKYECPEYMDEYQKILGIPIKKTIQPEISYLKTDGIELLLKQVDVNKTNGLRDYIILVILYTTGIRVSELINMRLKDISFSNPSTLLVCGKGKKARYVPLLKQVIPYLKKYVSMMEYDNSQNNTDFLFLNHMKEQFTRQGISYIVKKYSEMANTTNADIVPQVLSPHVIRHSTAMGMVEAGVDLIYIRDLLGHVSVVTTEVYAKTDAKRKREAIENATKNLVKPQPAKWDNNKKLKDWLMSF